MICSHCKFFKKNYLCLHWVFFLNWRIIALQCCVGFCLKQFESAVLCICPLPLEPPSLFPSHPSTSSQSARLGFLFYMATSYQLSILHMVVYICQSHSPNSSHLPFSTESKRPFSTASCLPCPASRFICTIFLDSIYSH